MRNVGTSGYLFDGPRHANDRSKNTECCNCQTKDASVDKRARRDCLTGFPLAEGCLVRIVAHRDCPGIRPWCGRLRSHDRSHTATRRIVAPGKGLQHQGNVSRKRTRGLKLLLAPDCALLVHHQVATKRTRGPCCRRLDIYPGRCSWRRLGQAIAIGGDADDTSQRGKQNDAQPRNKQAT